MPNTKLSRSLSGRLDTLLGEGQTQLRLGQSPLARPVGEKGRLYRVHARREGDDHPFGRQAQALETVLAVFVYPYLKAIATIAEDRTTGIDFLHLETFV